MLIFRKISANRYGILIAILFLAAYLRLIGLFDQGFFFYDEAFIINRAAALKANLFSGAFPLSLKGTYIDSKILWIYFVILAQFIFAGHFLSAHFLSVFFALLTIFLTYKFAKTICHSSLLGLLSAFFISVYPSHIYYSRTALPEMASAAFGLMALLSFYDGIKKGKMTYIVSSGLFTGLGFMLNRYRVILLPVFVLILYFYLMRKRSLAFHRTNLKKMAIYLGSIFIPVLIYQSLYFFCKKNNLYLPAYLAALKGSVQSHPFPSWHPEALFEHLYFIYDLEGIFWLILFLASPFFIRFRKASALILSFVVLQFSISFIVDERTPRTLSFVLPFLCILASMSFYCLMRFCIKKVNLRVAVILMILIVGLFLRRAFDVPRYQFNIFQAVQWLSEQKGDGKFVATNPSASLFSNKGTLIYPWAPIPYSLTYLRGLGYEFILVDPATFVLYYLNEKYRWNGNFSGLMQEILSCKPVNIFGNIHPDSIKRMVFEANRDFVVSRQMLEGIQAGKDKVVIYNIDKCLYEYTPR